MTATLYIVDVFRVLAILLCGVVLGVAVAEAKLYVSRLRRQSAHAQRLPFMIALRVGIMLTAAYVALSIGSRIPNPILTWRVGVGMLVMAIFLVGMIGILRDDQRYLEDEG